MADKKVNPLPEGVAECVVCGERMPADDEIMYTHQILNHPTTLLTQPKIGQAIGRVMFDLGVKLAEVMRNGK